MTSPWWCRRCPARPTNWWNGAATPRRCTTRANMTPWSPPANRSPPDCWRSRCRRSASRRAPGRAGRSRSGPATPTPRRGSSRSTAARSSTASRIARRSPSSPASRASIRRPTGSPRSAAAVPTPRRWRLPPPSTPTAAISIPTSTASIPPTRAWFPRRAGSTRSRSRTCWNWLRRAPRCCRCVRWNSAWCTTCRYSSAPASTSPRISTRTARRRAR